MKTYSKLLNKYYDSEKVVYVVNMLQATRYMKNGCDKHLVDILYENTKREDSLVFVFERCPETHKAKELWDKHELN